MNALVNALHNELQISKSSTIIEELFHIQTQSRVTCCSCKTADTTTERTAFLPLLLPLPKLHPQQNCLLLEDLLSFFFEEDTLDGDYYCQKCDTMTQAKQKTSLRHPLPRVIIIQLKRFTFDDSNNKIHTLVKYPLQKLNVRKYLAQTSNNQQETETIYHLIAVSRHTGSSVRSGHYTTYAKHFVTGAWHHFNDNYIESVRDKKTVFVTRPMC
ncbi:unnamed protein product [Didymodactylos carnosus]|uniref:ubiquitinyl hydrolase 1 n=1 Tax=Didymodactylos carnosus TaxID=1234261 RepID=A0A814JI21_9BILA|nr:unnamed protein product [Didymodactylos carnosus]CAF1237704.1 unnamed protein product [Didymodactylos carnosus]CAF3808818.1 unnamed protein product [Didymodactylos carnosus]CAF4045357.1 unnamed protein product [Didymodactylos carnosus]